MTYYGDYKYDYKTMAIYIRDQGNRTKTCFISVCCRCPYVLGSALFTQVIVERLLAEPAQSVEKCTKLYVATLLGALYCKCFAESMWLTISLRPNPT